MKKMKSFRKMLALVLALMMVVGIVSAHADTKLTNCDFTSFVYDPNGLTVNVNESFDAQDNTSNIYLNDIDITGNLTVNVSAEGKTADVGLKSILGDETIIADKGIAGVDVNDKVGGKVSITASNSGEAYSLNGNDITGNVIINAETGGTAELTLIEVASYDNADIGGAATLTASGGGTVGLEAGDITGTTTVSSTGTAEGDAEKPSTVTVSAQDTGAVVSDVYSGGKADITVEDVKVEGTGSVAGVSVNQGNGAGSGTTTVKADSVSATTTGDKSVYGLNVKDGTVIIGENDNATGGVTAKGDLAYAIIADGNANVTVSKGDVTAEGDYADGIKGTASDGKKAMVSILEGDVTANNGIWVVANNGGQYTLTATGKDGGKVNAGQAGIDADADGAGSKTTVNVNSVTQTGNNGYGINTLVGNGGEVLITVNGDITSEKSTGVCATITGDGNIFSAVTISADGMISGKTAGMDIGATGTKGGNVNVFSDISSENGVGLKLFDNGQGAKTSVLIDGTVFGNNAIIVDNDDAAKNIDLTVWKAESTGEEKPLVAGGDYVQDDATVSKFTAAINYIVKLADGLNNDQVVTDKGKTITINEGQENEKTWQTAKENEIVTLTLTDEQLADYNPEKNELEVLYNADDATSKMALGTSAGNGVFTFVNKVITLVMQSGGGMKLGFSFKAKTPEVQPEENQPEVKPDEKPEEKPEVKPAEEKVESKQEAKTDEPKQEAVQTVADTTSTIAMTGTATVYNLLKIKDTSGKAELAFRNVGKYEIKSPDGNDEGTFGMEDGKIVLTSQTGKKMNIGQDGKLEYVIGNQTYEFKFGEADLEKLAAVKK